MYFSSMWGSPNVRSVVYSGLRESCNFCVVDERRVRMLKIQIPMLCARNFVMCACVIHGWRFKFCKIDANRCSAGLLDRLRPRGPQLIFLDADFSSLSISCGLYVLYKAARG